jgi:hypothetical protein
MPNEQSTTASTNGRDYAREARVLTEMLSALQDFSPEGREHILKTIAAFYGVPPAAGPFRSDRPNVSSSVAAFSEDRSPTPKQFMQDKRPVTDIERAAALAYYLTHYRNQPHFKTLDLSQLNTEAAQIKLSNPSKAIDNAIRAGLISQASKGMRQLSAVGELYVEALPDREAAREAIKHVRHRRKSRRAGQHTVTGTESE